MTNLLGTDTPIRSRIIGLQKIKANELKAHPDNWRVHPQSQMNALKLALSNIGYINPIQAINTPEGYLIVDGHLRAGIAGNDEVEVLLLDLTPDEAKKTLITEDAITGLATEDTEKFHALIQSLSEKDQNVIGRILSESTLSITSIPTLSTQGIFDIKDLPDTLPGESTKAYILYLTFKNFRDFQETVKKYSDNKVNLKPTDRYSSRDGQKLLKLLRKK